MSTTADFYNQFHKRLELPAHNRRDITRELESHRQEVVEDLLAAGADEPDAEREALERLGAPDQIASQFNAVHHSCSPKAALLSAAPFLAWAVCLAVPGEMVKVILGSILCTVLLAGTLYGMRRGARPVWAATWLGAGYMGAWHLASYFDCAGPHGNKNMPNPGMVMFIVSIAYFGCLLWKSPRWRWPALAFVAVLLSLDVFWPMFLSRRAGIPHAVLNAGSAGIAIGVIALFYTGVLRLFASSPHGSPWRASLFLFALCASLNAWDPLMSSWPQIAAFACVGVAVIRLAMAPSERSKTLWFSLGLLAKFGLLDVMSWQYHPTLAQGARIQYGISYLVGLVIMWSILTLVTLFPMLISRRRRADRQEIAAG